MKDMPSRALKWRIEEGRKSNRATEQRADEAKAS